MNNQPESGFTVQFKQLREMNPNTIIFLYLGTFYNLLGIDAMIGHEVLGLKLGVRAIGNGKSVPKAGVPITAGLTYGRKLRDLGFQVAIVDQVAGTEHGVMKRVVTEIFEPASEVIDINAEYSGKYRKYMDGEFKQVIERQKQRHAERQAEVKAFKVINQKQGFDFEAALLGLDLEELTPLEAHKKLVDWKLKLLLK